MQITTTAAVPQNTSQPSASATGTKGSEGAFGQALDQSITTGSADQVQKTADGAAVTEQVQVQTVMQNAMSGVLSETPSADQLISIVDQLIESISNVESNGEEEKVPGEEMDESLNQLDSLLAVLENIPVLQSFVNEQQQPTVTTAGDDTAIGALKGMLQDLRAILQQDKTNAIGKDLMKEIGKQVAKIEQMITGNAASESLPQGEITTDATTAAVPAATTHLNRLSAQLLHAGILTMVPAEEQTTAESIPIEADAAADIETTGLPTSAIVHEHTQRAEHTAKVVVEQPVPVQKFAETMKDMMVKQFNVNTVGGIHEATLSLAPAHLGQVDVRISVHNGQLTALFVAESANAKDMLDNQMAQLRSSLQAQGLQVEKIEVTQSSAAFESNMFHKGNSGQNSRDQQSAKRGNANDQSIGEIANFDADLEQLAVERAVTRTLGFGREINTTA